MITEITEESNLILDPELHSYYLMEVVALRASPLIDQIDKFGAAKYRSSTGAAEGQQNLARQEGILRALQGEFNASFIAGLNNGGQTVEINRLRRLNDDVQASLEKLTATQNASDVQTNSRAARHSILRAALMTNEHLAIVLNARIDRVVSGQHKVLFSAGILFVCAMGLALTLLLRGIVSPLSQLTSAMKRVARGQLDVDPPSRNRRDEIGDMARALAVFKENAVARIQAEHAASAKAEFLAVMSHEIRTPMNGVLGMTQALASTNLEYQQRKMLEVIQECGDTLLALLNDILDMSKIEAGKLELEAIAFSPERLLQSACSLFDERASQKNLQLLIEIAPGSAMWRLGDPARLRQVVSNLVSNAIKFTENGCVTLYLDRRDDGAMVIQVRDTGIGIPQDCLAGLFAKFTQVDSSHTRVYGGTGLGLSIAKAIIDCMDGTFTVESEMGAGSCFTIALPLEIAAPILVKKTDEVLVPPMPVYREIAQIDDRDKGERCIRVLVAEDNATNRLVLKTLLESLGIVPTFAENGQEALDAWQQSSFDVILMDMQMPVMDGLSAMRRIRAIEAQTGAPRLPIVALTAHAMAHQVEEQVAAGADTHSAKPIQLSALILAIEGAIDRCEAINAGHIKVDGTNYLSSDAAESAA